MLHYVVNLTQTHHLSYFLNTLTHVLFAQGAHYPEQWSEQVYTYIIVVLLVARVGFKGAQAQLRILCLSCIRDVVCGANIQARALTRRWQECSECTLFYLHNRVCIFIKYTVLLWTQRIKNAYLLSRMQLRSGELCTPGWLNMLANTTASLQCASMCMHCKCTIRAYYERKVRVGMLSSRWC